MKRAGLWGAGLVGVLLLILAVNRLIDRFTGPVQPDSVVTQERARDSAAVADALRQDSISHAAVDSMSAVLEQERQTRAREQARHLANANAKNQRIRELLAADSALRDARATFGTDSVGLIAIDTASTCEERYELRTGEALDLRQALTECDAKAAADSTRAQLVADSFSTAIGRLRVALQQSDLARVREINRPRPCREDLVFFTVSCGTMNLISFGAGVTTAILVTN